MVDCLASVRAVAAGAGLNESALGGKPSDGMRGAGQTVRLLPVESGCSRERAGGDGLTWIALAVLKNA